MSFWRTNILGAFCAMSVALAAPARLNCIIEIEAGCGADTNIGTVLTSYDERIYDYDERRRVENARGICKKERRHGTPEGCERPRHCYNTMETPQSQARPEAQT